MLWRRKREKKNRAPLNRKSLRFEPLESRQMLAGNVVSIATAGTNLVLAGNDLSNSIEIRQLSVSTPGAFQIKGVDGTKLDTGLGQPLLDTYAVYGINGNVSVNLGQGQDALSVLPPVDAPTTGKTIVLGDLIVVNDMGGKEIEISGVRVNHALNVSNVAAANVTSTLSIESSTVQGATSLVNDGSGNTDTTIKFADLQGTLTVENGDGFASLYVQESKIGTAAGGATSIVNGAAGSITTFTAGSTKSTVLYGSLSITNGAAPQNEVDFINTDVRRFVTINNATGNTVTVVTNSELGSDLVAASPLTLVNAAGFDSLDVSASSQIQWGAHVDNGVAGDYYGSTTTIKNSSIGTNSVDPAGLTLDNDDFDALVDIEKTVIAGVLTINNGNGNSTITLGASGAGLVTDTTVGALAVSCAAGNNVVTVQNATVYTTTNVVLGTEIDAVTLNNVVFKSTTVFDGGDGINDTILQTLVTRPVGYSFDVLNFEG